MDFSFCSRPESENSADLTAKSSPEDASAARKTVAEEPRPMMGPLLHSMASSCGCRSGIVEYGKRSRTFDFIVSGFQWKAVLVKICDETNSEIAKEQLDF